MACRSRSDGLLEPERRHELARHARGLVALDELDRRAALDDRAVEQALRGRHREQRRDLAPAAGLSEYGHAARVAAEARDVRAHPAQRVHDVEHAGVARLREIRPDQIAEIGEAEHVEAMVDRYHDDVAAPGEVGAVGHRRRARARREAAAVAPQHHRPLGAVERRRPDVEDEAVLAFGRQARARDRQAGVGGTCSAGIALRRARTVVERVAHAAPALGIGRRHEAVRSGGARSVRNALERLDAVDVGAAHAAE